MLSRRKAAYSSTDEEDPMSCLHVGMEWKLQASNINNLAHLNDFLKAFCVPGTVKPYIYNTPATQRAPYGTEFTEFPSGNHNSEHNMKEMLGFLFNGETERINTVYNILEEFVKKKDVWQLTFLDMLDSDPVPTSGNPEDFKWWLDKKLKFLVKNKREMWSDYTTLKQIVSDIHDICMSKSCPDVRHSSSDMCHDKWRRVIGSLLSVLSPVYIDMIEAHYRHRRIRMQYRSKGDIKDKLPFYKHIYRGETFMKKAGGSQEQKVVASFDHGVRYYSVAVEPDMMLQTIIHTSDKYPALNAYDDVRILRSLTMGIGSEVVNHQKLFTTRASESDSSAGALKGSAEDIDMEEDSESGPEDDRAGCAKRSKPKKYDKRHDIRQSAHICSHVGHRVTTQHLLELIASARHNVETLKGSRWKKQVDEGECLTTGGMLWFHNGLFLTRLDAVLTDLDGQEHDQSGEYIIWDKFINPLNGNWRSIACYWLACSLAYHTLDDPSNT